MERIILWLESNYRSNFGGLKKDYELLVLHCTDI